MRFIVLGGDLRHDALADWAEKNGHIVARYQDNHFLDTKDPSRDPAVWVLPILSLTRKRDHAEVRGLLDCPMDSVLGRLRDGDMLVYAELDREIGEGWQSRYPTVQFVNILEQEFFVSENAILTAEGALCLAAQQSPVAFWDSRCLIIGYGHIGKALSRYLQAMGAEVWVSARKDSDLAAISAHRLRPIHTCDLYPVIGRQDFIFNTVPARVMDDKAIGLIEPDARILDLASTPYGADDQQMENAGRKYVRYPGIPGKMYPVSAGRIIYREIMNQIRRDRGIRS